MPVLETTIRPSVTSGEAGSRLHAWLESLGERPVLASLASGSRFRCTGSEAPMLTVTAEEIGLADGFLSYGEAAELVLRYACEVSLLMRLGITDHVLIVLMAARMTHLILANASVERQSCYVRQAPAHLLDAIGGMAEPLSPQRLPGIASTLLKLEGKTLPPCNAQDLFAKLRKCSDLCMPTECLLLRDGDERLACNPETGRSLYGCQPFPEAPEHITFASSTATSISEGAFAAVEFKRRRLLSYALHGDLPRALEAEFDAVRDEIVGFFGFQNDRVDVALSPSGTDSHLQALAIARLNAGSRPIFSIVTAPNETGSGVAMAVSGRHFSNSTALNGDASRGVAIDELGGDDVTLASVPIRDAPGRPLSTEALVEEITRLITQAHCAGRYVLLQVIDVSKTGIVMLGTAALRKLVEAFPDNLLVVVDACQMRVSNDIVAGYIDLGALVCVTASKFFTAPPFAGALLIPRARASRHCAPEKFASGCGAYFARSDWPTGWSAAASLPVSVNLGVLLRWRAGLHEMAEFGRVPAAARKHILASLGSAIATSIARAAMFELIESPGRAWVEGTERGEWDEIQTIFSFRVRRAGPELREFLTFSELRALYQKMNEDVTQILDRDSSHKERELARIRCHIGQPVALADAASDNSAAVVRISTSARLVSYIWAHGTPALTHARLAGAIANIGDALDKLALLNRYMFDKQSTFAGPD